MGDRFRGGDTPLRKVGLAFGLNCYRLGWLAVAGSRNDRGLRGYLAFLGSSTGGDEGQNFTLGFL